MDIDKEEVDTALFNIRDELYRAIGLHYTMASKHEGYAILLEEVDELWDEIKNRNFSSVNIRKEAIQVAAMALEIAIRFGTDEDE